MLIILCAIDGHLCEELDPCFQICMKHIHFTHMYGDKFVDPANHASVYPPNKHRQFTFICLVHRHKVPLEIILDTCHLLLADMPNKQFISMCHCAVAFICGYRLMPYGPKAINKIACRVTFNYRFRSFPIEYRKSGLWLRIENAAFCGEMQSRMPVDPENANAVALGRTGWGIGVHKVTVPASCSWDTARLTMRDR